MSLGLTDAVDKIKFIREQYALLLAKLEIVNVKDLLTHFPSYYLDTSHIASINKIDLPGKFTVRVTIGVIKNIYTKSRKQIQQADVYDSTGSIKVVWFNQPFLTRTLKAGQEVLLHGEFKIESGKGILYSPEYEMLGSKTTNTHLGRISGIYPLTRGITTKWLKKRILDALEKLNEFTSSTDKYFKLTSYEALKAIHFPNSLTSLEEATTRLAYEELISIMLRVERVKQQTKNILGVQIKQESKLVRQFIDSLPFKLTNEQSSSIREILADLAKPQGMNRLLQGDVGSGKTVVAISAALASIESGYQVVMLAPTVLLAKQHYTTVTRLVNKLKIKVGLVTAHSTADSDCQIFIGTSAILARKQMQFKRLGLVIVDEQHRFGVNQRLELQKLLKAQGELLPNLLDMTATPIPRSIALTFFGDMELSRIRQKPNDRLPINTHIVKATKRQDCYNWVKDQLSNGRQCYWVCPLIEDSEIKQTKAAKTTYANLVKEFSTFRVGLIHGKLKESEKQSTMESFEQHKIDLLVATTVIEVGIDVPNATVMIIEDADTLGLAQLHQIRGRVGRSNLQSWCFVFESNEITEKGKERLNFFATHQDGLEIAEFDLQNRGPGEVYGTKQSGIPDLKIAKLNNYEMITRAKEVAQELIEIDKGVETALF